MEHQLLDLGPGKTPDPRIQLTFNFGQPLWFYVCIMSQRGKHPHLVTYFNPSYLKLIASSIIEKPLEGWKLSANSHSQPGHFIDQNSVSFQSMLTLAVLCLLMSYRGKFNDHLQGRSQWGGWLWRHYYVIKRHLSKFRIKSYSIFSIDRDVNLPEMNETS